SPHCHFSCFAPYSSSNSFTAELSALCNTFVKPPCSFIQAALSPFLSNSSVVCSFALNKSNIFSSISSYIFPDNSSNTASNINGAASSALSLKSQLLSVSNACVSAAERSSDSNASVHSGTNSLALKFVGSICKSSISCKVSSSLLSSTS